MYIYTPKDRFNFISDSFLLSNLCRYAMKCLDKKRIKMKQGETLALNERIMLSLVSTGVSKLLNYLLFCCYLCFALGHIRNKHSFVTFIPLTLIFYF